MLGVRQPLWTLPKHHTGGITSLSSWETDLQTSSSSTYIQLPSLNASPHSINHSLSTPGAPQQLNNGHNNASRGGDPLGVEGSAGGSSSSVRAATLDRIRLQDLVVSGGKDGSLKIVEAATGHLLQVVERAHHTTRRTGLGGLFSGGVTHAQAFTAHVAGAVAPLPAAASTRSHPGSQRESADGGGRGVSGGGRRMVDVAAAVSGVQCCREGVVSTGADGAVRLHPLGSLLSSSAI